MKNFIFLLVLLLSVNLVWAEYPVYFADVNLQSAVEEELGITDPTPTDMLNLTYLDASNRGISDLTGIEWAVNLQDIRMGKNSITDISPIDGLTNLQIIYCNDNSVNDINPVSNLTNLKTINFDRNDNISDISYLGNLSSLNHVSFQTNNITDMSVVSGLTDLTYLALSGNNISDPSAVGILTNLTSLGLGYNQISDISIVADMYGLTFLYLYGNQLSDISPISNLTDLTFLNIGANQISDISHLAGLTKLETLGLTGNLIDDISVLSAMSELKVLAVGNNEINDISILANKSKLEQLDIQVNQISNISFLISLTNLEVLRLDNNNIADISALSCLTNLTDLRLLDNPLDCFSYCVVIPAIEVNNPGINITYDPMPIECDCEVIFADSNLQAAVEEELAKQGIYPPITRNDMLNLTYLDARRIGIIELAGLEHATSLEDVYLEGNNISDISCLEEMTSLELLHIHENFIQDISSLTNLTSLWSLALDTNPINDYSPVSSLVNLKRLYIRNRGITDISFLANLTSLEDVYLEGNNISDISCLSDLISFDRLQLHGNPLDKAAYCIHFPLVEKNNPDIDLTYDPNPNPLLGDCDGNCFVDLSDYSILGSKWLEIGCGECDGADQDGDNNVGMEDLRILTENWLNKVHLKLYSYPLDNDPNWPITGQWAFGQPMGEGGTEHGNPDPDSGFTGTEVFGVNLNGDYSTIPGGPYYLTAGPFDCTYLEGARLRFARWLNADEPRYVRNFIEASSDGVSWIEVWEHTDRVALTDNAWQMVDYDINGVADRQAEVYIRWGYEILSDQAYPYSGWNIDDVELWGSSILH